MKMIDDFCKQHDIDFDVRQKLDINYFLSSKNTEGNKHD